jgi:hypothetical protein
MMIYECYLQCDECWSCYHNPSSYAQEAQATALANGWIRNKHGDFCPHCATGHICNDCGAELDIEPGQECDDYRCDKCKKPSALKLITEDQLQRAVEENLEASGDVSDLIKLLESALTEYHDGLGWHEDQDCPYCGYDGSSVTTHNPLSHQDMNQQGSN